MKLDINDAIIYGSFEDDSDDIYWLEISNYTFFSTTELIDDFLYIDSDDIVRSQKYIQLFHRNIVELEKEYIERFNKESMKNDIRLILERNEDYDYNLAFKIFIEESGLDQDWFEYKRSVLIADAIQWCKKNNILYYLPYIDERSIQLQDIVDHVMLSVDDELHENISWFEKSSFSFIQTQHIVKKFCYKDYNEIMKSGLFIPLFEFDLVKLKKDFIDEIKQNNEKINIQQSSDFQAYGYGDDFNDFINKEGLYHCWHNYIENRIFEMAENWCMNNSIPYIGKEKSIFLEEVLDQSGDGSMIDKNLNK